MRLGFARFHGTSKRTLTHTTSSWCGRRPGWRMSSVFLVTVPLRGQCPIIVVGAGKLPFSPPEHYFHLFSTSFAWHLFSEPQRGIGGLFQYKPMGGEKGEGDGAKKLPDKLLVNHRVGGFLPNSKKKHNRERQHHRGLYPTPTSTPKSPNTTEIWP